ncbi:MAG: hypothetical protein ACHQ6T_13300 [Myxococcota bacterium]
MLRVAVTFAALILADAVVPDWDGIAPPARPTRLATHAGSIFLGTESGLYRRSANDSGGWSLVLGSEPIADLASAGPELFIATPAGLWVWTAERESAQRLSLGAGGSASGIAVDDAGAVWVATAAGLFRRAPGALEFARDESVPAGQIDAVACAGGEVWVGLAGALYSGGGERGFTRRLTGVEEGWWQLRGAVRSGDVTLLGVASGLWRIDRAGSRQLELGVGQIYRLARAGERIFVAAERGLYRYAIGELGTGAGRQTLSVEALGLGVEGDRLLIATDRGLAALALETGDARVTPAPARALDRHAHARRVAELQRAVLEYQEIAPARLREIERRARWKGLYPELRAGGGLDRDGAWDAAQNETFTTGALHHLSDADHTDHHGYDAAVTLTWQLSDFVSPDDPLAVSRERRLVVSLRDQVLERVNHLYFQRLQVLGQIEVLASDDGARRAELELAAAEIAAQLDAWSGGAFSRLEDSSPLEDQREP